MLLSLRRQRSPLLYYNLSNLPLLQNKSAYCLISDSIKTILLFEVPIEFLSLSRLCARLSLFLHNLRTNRKLAYYTQLQLNAYTIKIASVGSATRHKRYVKRGTSK